ncbi:MAG: hypothetical protein QM764_02990 [Chitinophagaceae bacterium]
MKDLFIDANIANKFADPPDEDYKNLTDWLWNFNPNNLPDNARLVVCQKLINDYFDGNRHCAKPSSIVVLYDKMLREGRIDKIKKDQIEQFQAKYFNWKSIRCKTAGSSDPCLIPLIFLSVRKLGLSEDIDLIYDIQNLPKWKNKATIKDHPSQLTYK